MPCGRARRIHRYLFCGKISLTLFLSRSLSLWVGCVTEKRLLSLRVTTKIEKERYLIELHTPTCTELQ